MSNGTDSEDLSDFQLEFHTSIDKFVAALVALRDDYRQSQRLELTSHFLDHVGHTTKRMAIDLPGLFTSAQVILLFVDLCKLIVFQSAQVHDNELVYTTSVNLLCDAGKKLKQMVEHLDATRQLDPHDVLTTKFIERLKWLEQRLPKDNRFPITIEQILESFGV